MKKLISIIIFVLLFSSLSATPPPSYWSDVRYIGHNDEFYYYYLHERFQDYYSYYYYYREELSIVKQSFKSDTINQKVKIRAVIYKSNPNIANSILKRHETYLNSVNPEKYLINENIFYQFPTTNLYNEDNEKLILNRYGLFYKYKNKYVYLLTYVFFEKKISGFHRWYNYEKTKLINYYSDDIYTFFIIETGEGYYDTNWEQNIFVVKTEELYKKIDKVM